MSANKLSTQYHPTVFHQAISPQPSTSSVLPQATLVSGYASDTHSPLTMEPQHCPPYGVPAYIPVSTYPPHVPPAAHMYHPGPCRCRLVNRLLLPSRSHQSHSMVTQGTHQLPVAVIHRIQDMNLTWVYPTLPHRPMGIPLTSGRRILGIPHSSCQSGILLRRRQLLLLRSINTEETSGGQGEREVQPDDFLVSASSSVLFLFDIVCVIWFSQPCFLVIYSLCNPCSKLSFLRSFVPCNLN